MKIYRIFLKSKDNGIIEDLEIVKEGFSFLAFIFQAFFLFYRKLWKQSFITLLIVCLLIYLQTIFFEMYVTIPFQLALSVYIGFEYQDWITNKMIKDGYQFLGYSSGNDEREAKLRFLDGLNGSYNENDKMEQKIF